MIRRTAAGMRPRRRPRRVRRPEPIRRTRADSPPCPGGVGLLGWPMLLGSLILARPVLARPVLARPARARPVLDRAVPDRAVLDLSGRPSLGRPARRWTACRTADGCRARGSA